MSDSGLKQIFGTMGPALTRYLLARGLSREDAEDVLQDLYLKIDGLLDGPIGEPRAYLYRMAHNLLLDRRRSAMRRVKREEDWSGGGTGAITEIDDQPSAEDVLIGRERLSIMARALATLPDRTRDIFRRFRIDGQTQKTIAQELGVSKSAVEKHLYKAYHIVAETKAALDEKDDESIAARERHRDMRDDNAL